MAATVDTSTDGFSEISGLVVSPTQVSDRGNPIAFAVNDSGDGARLGVFDSVTGEYLQTLQLSGGENWDWEDMTCGPCSGEPDETCIYIADTGDNPARYSLGEDNYRNDGPYRIYKIKEPIWTELDNYDTIGIDGVLEFDYKTGTLDLTMDHFDSEALFVDPIGWGDDGNSPGDLYVVTKWYECDAGTLNRVFYIPVSAWQEDGVYSPTVLEVDPSSSFMGPTWTGAEMSPDGTILALSTEDLTYLYLRCPGASIESTLAQQHCLLLPNPTPYYYQTETIAWTPDGKQLIRIPEGDGIPIFTFTLIYDAHLSEQVCAGSTINEEEVDLSRLSTPTPNTLYPPTASPLPLQSTIQQPHDSISDTVPGSITWLEAETSSCGALSIARLIFSTTCLLSAGMMLVV